MEFYVKQSVCKNHLFSPCCFMDGHEAESTFGMVKRRFAPWRLYSSAECTSLAHGRTFFKATKTNDINVLTVDEGISNI